jgi:hypothetical protein
MKVLKPSAIAACMLFALFACHNRLSDSKAEVQETRVPPVGENENKEIAVDKTVAIRPNHHFRNCKLSRESSWFSSPKSIGRKKLLRMLLLTWKLKITNRLMTCCMAV